MTRFISSMAEKNMQMIKVISPYHPATVTSKSPELQFPSIALNKYGIMCLILQLQGQSQIFVVKKYEENAITTNIMKIENPIISITISFRFLTTGPYMFVASSDAMTRRNYTTKKAIKIYCMNSIILCPGKKYVSHPIR